MTRDLLLPVGRVAGRRGTAGEMTIRVGSGDASWWDAVPRVSVGSDEEDAVVYEVETSRSYRDRLVLKLRGIDDAGAAETLRGRWVWVRREDAPGQPEGRWYTAELVGLEVVDERHGRIGTVSDILPTAAADLLVVRRDGAGAEVLVPMAGEILDEVDADAGIVRVRLPEGLIELER